MLSQPQRTEDFYKEKKMTSNERKETMKELKRSAKQADDNYDVVMREQYANSWHELSTDAESKKAPKYLTWIGRGFKK